VDLRECGRQGFDETVPKVVSLFSTLWGDAEVERFERWENILQSGCVSRYKPMVGDIEKQKHGNSIWKCQAQRFQSSRQVSKSFSIWNVLSSSFKCEMAHMVEVSYAGRPYDRIESWRSGEGERLNSTEAQLTIEAKISCDEQVTDSRHVDPPRNLLKDLNGKRSKGKLVR
jgi:hypothetical protein